jgi:hypothetical protein
MKVIAVIERPALVRQILDHLGLPRESPQLRSPPGPADALAAQQPREWSYEPLFDLPVSCSEAGQTGDLPIPDPPCLPAGRCSSRRGRRTGLPHAAPRSLRVQRISLDPPARPVVACPSTSASREIVPAGAVSAVASFRWLTLPGGASFQFPFIVLCAYR